MATEEPEEGPLDLAAAEEPEGPHRTAFDVGRGRRIGNRHQLTKIEENRV